MKRIVLLGVILFCLNSCQDKNAKLIQYEVQLIDPLTNQETNNPGLEVDWQFEVAYNDQNVRIWRKFADNFDETRIIDKPNDEVLFLKSEGKSKYAFHESISNILMMDMSSNYGDTTTKIMDEHKDILGYDCYKITMNLGNQAFATLWVTDEIDVGIKLPETPLSLNKAALEYEFKTPMMISKFKATNIEDVYEAFDNKTIPSGYKLIK